MAEKCVPKNVDWVNVRANCSVAAMFEQLRLEIESDIAARNATIAEPKVYSFRLISPRTSMFSVLREATQDPVGDLSVIFSSNGKEIAVKQHGDPTPFITATVTLNDEGECKFRINGTEKESWQFRRMALEDLFF